MAAIAEITKYPCNTQEETDPSFGPAPISNLAGTTGDNAPDEPDSLVVGFGTIVPRWDVKSSAETTDQASANFYLVYKVNPSFGNGRNTLAQAFFPHEVDQDVIVFSRAFEGNNLSILKNIFQHEIGHILGLRHEFAIEGDAAKDLAPEGHGAVLLGEKNYFSIMSYNFPPKFRDSDGTQTIGFYKLANGHMISGSPVTDFQPKIRRANR
ncbi:hypothetical protein H9Q73_000526 [Fusarium xylarioides]|nr:hypothetical protein H9Q73_000526 [Fusarium xylarioides]